MICPLCDTANGDSADVCTQCQMPLLVRDCRTCGALFSKAADRCPKCGVQAPAVAGRAKPMAGSPAVFRPIAALADRTTPIASNADRQLVQLQRRVERLEGELAASRPAPLADLAPATSVLVANDGTAPAERRKAPWLVLAGLIVLAAAGMVLYQFQEPLRRQFQPSLADAPSGPERPAVAADFKPLRPATSVAAGVVVEVAPPARVPALAPPPAPATQSAAAEPASTAPIPVPVAEALAEAEQLASVLAAKTEPAEPAGGEPPQVVFSPDDSNLSEGEAAEPPPAPVARLPELSMLPNAAEPAASPQVLSAQDEVQQPATQQRQAAGPVVDAPSLSAPEPIPVPVAAPEPAPRPAGAYDCRDAAVSALGLCGATR